MKKLGLVLVLLSVSISFGLTKGGIPHTMVSGKPALADSVNANFDTLDAMIGIIIDTLTGAFARSTAIKAVSSDTGTMQSDATLGPEYAKYRVFKYDSLVVLEVGSLYVGANDGDFVKLATLPAAYRPIKRDTVMGLSLDRSGDTTYGSGQAIIDTLGVIQFLYIFDPTVDVATGGYMRVWPWKTTFIRRR